MSIIQSVPRYGRNAAALLGCVTNETDSDQVSGRHQKKKKRP